MKKNDYQGKLLAAAKEIQNAVTLSRELFFVTFGVMVSSKFEDDKVEVTAKWWAPEEYETCVIISAEALADSDKPEWIHTIRNSFTYLDSKIREERFKVFQLKKIYG